MKILISFRMFCLFAIWMSVSTLSPTHAHAYIDPGTGATFVGSMVPLLVGIVGGLFAFFARFLWHPLLRLARLFRAQPTAEASKE